MFKPTIPFLLLLGLPLSTPAQADYRVVCQQGAQVVSRFVRNDSHFPVKVEVMLPGSPGIVITATAQLPPGAICRSSGAVTFLADASSDGGKSFHRVMTMNQQQADGSWLVEVAPDSFNGNFAYSALFNLSVKAAH